MSAKRWLVIVGIGWLAVGSITSGQAQTPALPAMDALLAEVRGLRAEVHQAAGASIRTQLLVARLSLQEQRTNGVAKQLADVQTQRAAMEGPSAQFDQRFKTLEEALRSPSTRPEDHLQFEKELESMKLVRADMHQRLQRLVNQESALAAQLSTEQSRWVEFNDRLDQVERDIAATLQRQ